MQISWYNNIHKFATKKLSNEYAELEIDFNAVSNTFYTKSKKVAKLKKWHTTLLAQLKDARGFSSDLLLLLLFCKQFYLSCL